MDHHEKVVAAARRWIGTPYRHQASNLGGGTDCLGLVRGVWREIIGPEPVRAPAYTKDWAEPSQLEILRQVAEQWLLPAPSGLQRGAVLLFRMREGCIAKHLGIVSEIAPTARFIHAYSGHAVVESALSTPWRRRIAAIYLFPEGA